MTARTGLTMGVLTLSMILTNVAGAVGLEVFTYQNETGSAFDLHDTASQANKLDDGSPSVLPTDGSAQWIDYIYGGSADAPPNGQFITHVIKPDLSELPAGRIENVEYGLNIYRSEFSKGTIGLARITEPNNLEEVSMRYRTTGTGNPSGSGVEWAGLDDGFPFISVERDDDGNIVYYGETDYDTDISTTESIIDNHDLNSFVEDVINGRADYHGFVVVETAGGNVGWCGSNNANAFCGAADGGFGEFNHYFEVTVPEPASMALLGMGGAMLLIRRRRD